MPTITGTEGTDILSGGADDDTILGLGGNDQLTGNGGNDTIEGGSGDDIITGSSGLDVLTGGDGVDVFRDTAAGLNGDRITDFLPGDRIQLTDLSIQNANIGINGSQLTFNGGSVTIDNLGPGRLIVREIQGGGVEVRLQAIAQNDFNGDGRSDILWRNDSGVIFDFLGTANGGVINNGDLSYVEASSDTTVAGVGDFNGDGRSDILWRDSSGLLFNFLGQDNGGFVNNGDNSAVSVSNDWQVAAVADFNGDGRSDILFRNSAGVIFNFLGTSTGGVINNGDNSYVAVDPSWSVAGVGDFNGDGKADILWRNDSGTIFNFVGQANGGVVNNGDNSSATIGSEWKVAGIGDFNGDGMDDILWRNDQGAIFNFLGNGSGGFSNNGDNSFESMDTAWHVQQIGDFNGDGRDDILWRHDNGTITNWVSTALGGFTDNSANSVVAVDNVWHIQAPDVLGL